MDGESASVIVRMLAPGDCDRLVRMDEQITGRTRRVWYEGKLKRALEDSDVRISLGADVDGVLAGALLGELHYGEFGLPEPVAVLDTLLVDPAFRRQRVGTALLQQFLKNLTGLRIERVRTEVGWDEQDLVAFFGRSGFAPVPRIVLELDVSRAARDAEGCDQPVL